MESEKVLKGLEPLDKCGNAHLIQSLKCTVKKGFVEKFLEGNERPCDKNDFFDTKKKGEELTLNIKQSVENLIRGHFYNTNVEENISHCCPSIDNEFLALIIILIGQNNSFYPWNTEVTVKNCETLSFMILKLFNCKDMPELILKNKIGLVKKTLQILCADLTVTTWKHFPASVVCYKWILEMITQPELSQHLQFVLPPALLLIDDFVTQNRIIGAQCLNHIVKNITMAELQLHGHGDVIYSALLPLLRIREADLIYSVVQPLVSVTTKLEFDLGKKNPTKWSRFDNILEIFLENMELEQMIDLRICYIDTLNLLITACEYKIIRWSKRLLRIFDEYMQTAGKYNDEKTITHCIKVIETFIKFTRDISFIHARHLIITLLIALHFINNYKSGICCESKEITVKCIKELLKSLSEVETENFKSEFKEKLSNNINLCVIYQQLCDIHSDIDHNK